MRHPTILLAGILAIGTAREGRSQAIEYSADLSVAVSGVVASDEDVVADGQGGIPVIADLGAIPADADVDGYERLQDGSRLFSVDSYVELGGWVASAADVVRYDGAFYTIEFDASAAGIRAGVDVDAVAVDGSGGLVLSFDLPVDLGDGRVAADEDLVRFDGSSFSLFFDGSAAGVDPALDLDAATVDRSGRLLLSFDLAGTIDGLSFSDDTVVAYGGGIWTTYFDPAAVHASYYVGADVDAISAPKARPPRGRKSR